MGTCTALLKAYVPKGGGCNVQSLKYHYNNLPWGTGHYIVICLVSRAALNIQLSVVSHVCSLPMVLPGYKRLFIGKRGLDPNPAVGQ